MWENLRQPPGEKYLAYLGTRTNYHPRCLWECGLLPLPEANSLPGRPPTMDEPFSGAPVCLRHKEGTVYSDGSAVFPRDQPTRRAAFG
eukprot:15641877-Heterocapsa_arctica.AAC.1